MYPPLASVGIGTRFSDFVALVPRFQQITVTAVTAARWGFLSESLNSKRFEFRDLNSERLEFNETRFQRK
jgi:hypothetical protein